MKKAIVILILLLSVPALAAWSDNISMTEGWDIRYKKEWSDSPYTFMITNESGNTALEITVWIYFYDHFGKEIEIKKFEYKSRYKGPLKSGYGWQEIVDDYPKETSSVKAEIFCDYK